MKLLHAADLHLGSKLDSVFPKAIADKRRAEVRASFQRMIEYAEENGISVILLAGDVFDSDTPTLKDKDFFKSAVKAHPDIDFLYLRGNHDKADFGETIDNLKTFSSVWTSYTYGDVVVTGLERSEENASSYYTSLSLDPEKTNIVMLHGQIESADGPDSISLFKLRDKNIDYLALGHIHSYAVHKLDARGNAVYAGCLEGRGFDETGEKGFVLVDTDREIKHTFISFSRQPIDKVTLDLSGIDTLYDVIETAKAAITDRSAIYRIELVGRSAITDLKEKDIESALSPYCAFVSVKSYVKKTIDIHAYDGDLSLLGEFVRGVWASEDYTDEEKTEIILYGLKALRGEEVES